MKHASIEKALLLSRRAEALLQAAGRGEDGYEANQRAICGAQLAVMISQLSSGELPERSRRRSVMGQMVGDQWDPDAELTSAVLGAEQAYLSVR